MAQIIARWADDHAAIFANRVAELQRRLPMVLPRTVNRVGNRAKTQVIRALTRQTGLPRKTIVRAIGTPSPARTGKLSYEMATQGGNIRLKYVSPRETRRGVVAKPWNKRTLFAGTFMKGGRFPDRKAVARFDGHVYRRLNSSGTKITQVRSGMFIPVEMVSGQTAAAFEATAAPLLKREVEKAIAKLLG